ncbi:MAG: hypothetical protein AAF514_09505, partial [Verrucomicrobiota bacterium]
TTEAGNLYLTSIFGGDKVELIDDAIASDIALATAQRGHLVATLAASPRRVELRGSHGGGIKVNFKTEGQNVHALEVSPQGKLLVAAGSGPALRVWNMETETELFEWGRREMVEHVAFSHDGAQLAVSTQTGHLRVFSTADWNLLASDPYDGKPGPLYYSPDGSGLYSGTSRGFVIYWTGEPTREPVLGDHPGQVCHVEYTRDGQWLVAGSDDGTVTIWNTRLRGRQQVIPGVGEVEGRFFAVSPDASVIAVLRPAAIGFHSIDSGAELRTIDHAGPLAAIAFSPDGDLIGELPQNGDEILRWRAASYEESERIRRPARPDFIPERVRTVHPFGAVYASHISWDERRILTADPGGGICLWNTETWRRVATFPSSCGAFSPDGKILALGEGRNIRLLEAPKGVIARWDAYAEHLIE